MVGQTHSASRVIKAAPQAIYTAHLQPEAVAAWRPPQGMSAQIRTFEAVEGGVYRMSFLYDPSSSEVHGKTAEHEDAFEGRFVELVADTRIVEQVDFTSDDPAFAGTMTITTTLTPVADGTHVAIVCDNVPIGISERDHLDGIESTLSNLARFTERLET